MSAMLSVGSGSAPVTDPGLSASASSHFTPVQLSAACELLALLVQSQSAAQSGSKTDVEIGTKRLEELKQQLADSIQHAKDASKHSGFLGFLGDVFGSDIGQIACAVAAAAAVVASGGTAAVLVVVALSDGLQLAAKAGAELGLDPKICLVMNLASAAVGFCSGVGEAQAASTLANAARDVEVGAKVVQSSATIAGGALHGVAGYYRGQQLNYQADAAGYQGSTDATSLTMDDAIARLERALRTEQRVTNTVSEIAKDNADTNMTLSERI